MRRIYISIALTVVAATLFAAAASGQSGDERRQYAGEVRAAAARCDSLAGVMERLRKRYSTAAEDERRAIGMEIVALEGESYAAKADYDAAVMQLTRIGGRLADIAEQRQDNGAAAGGHTMQNADLVRNGWFAANLDRDSYAMLLDAQSREKTVADAAGEYRDIYAEMLDLQSGYDSAPTEIAADSLKIRYAEAEQRARQVENTISSNWNTLFDNKMYIYNLSMEKSGRTEIIDAAERLSADAERAISESRGRYNSDVLAEYCLRKRALVDSEIMIAEALGLVSARDSLARVASTLRNIDFRTAKIDMDNRVFIEYEPVKVITPTIYRAGNPIPKTRVYAHGTIYRIRVGVFSNPPNPAALRGVTPLSYTTDYHDGRYACFAGGFRTIDEANEAMAYLKRLGFKDPQIAMWHNAEYVTDIAKWEDEHAQRYNIEISGVAALTDEVKRVIAENDSDCTISRAGNIFIVGKFADNGQAEAVAAAVSSALPGAEVSIREIENKQ